MRPNKNVSVNLVPQGRTKGAAMTEQRQEIAADTSGPLSFPVFRALWIATIISNPSRGV